MRKQIVVGNWKMNKTLEEGETLTSEIINATDLETIDDVHLILAPPFTHLAGVQKLIEAVPNIHLGAQNCAQTESGAYTGEISASMIRSSGAEYVIIGHSERREYFNEQDVQVAMKVDMAVKHGLTPIFCCGESLEIRDTGKHEAFVTDQISKGLFHLSKASFSTVIIAYEPIWAIGTGETATSGQAQEMHRSLRSKIESHYGQEVADQASILYGGSCKPANASELFAEHDVDGGLIGGAALSARDFVAIARSFH